MLDETIEHFVRGVLDTFPLLFTYVNRIVFVELLWCLWRYWLRPGWFEICQRPTAGRNVHVGSIIGLIKIQRFESCRLAVLKSLYQKISHGQIIFGIGHCRALRFPVAVVECYGLFETRNCVRCLSHGHVDATNRHQHVCFVSIISFVIHVIVWSATTTGFVVQIIESRVRERRCWFKRSARDRRVLAIML